MDGERSQQCWTVARFDSGPWLHQNKIGGIIVPVTCGIKGLDGLLKQLDGEKKASEKVLKASTADAKKRVPGWVATEVVKEYGVKKTEITGNKIGKVTTKGDNIKNLKVIYTGRVLTHTHFGMTPKTPKPNREPYTLKAAVIKGQKKTLGKVKKLTKKQTAALANNLTRSGQQTSEKSPIMLMRANGGHYLPFQRKSTNRNDIEAIKTVSLPQMVSSERTKANIRKAIDEGLQKRLEHHMKRFGMK